MPILSKIDYNNIVIHPVPEYLLKRLQQPPPQALRFSQGTGELLVMNRKRPWQGYRRRAKCRLARCLLPAFLCAHIFIERETSGYEAAPTTSPVSRCRLLSLTLCAYAGSNQTRMDTSKGTQRVSIT